MPAVFGERAGRVSRIGAVGRRPGSGVRRSRALKNFSNKIMSRIDATSLRERVLLFVALAAVLAAIAIERPVLVERSATSGSSMSYGPFPSCALWKRRTPREPE